MYLKETVKLPDERFIREAFSERLDGSVREQKVVLTGSPRVLQKSDIIKELKLPCLKILKQLKRRMQTPS